MILFIQGQPHNNILKLSTFYCLQISKAKKNTQKTSQKISRTSFFRIQLEITSIFFFLFLAYLLILRIYPENFYLLKFQKDVTNSVGFSVVLDASFTSFLLFLASNNLLSHIVIIYDFFFNYTHTQILRQFFGSFVEKYRVNTIIFKLLRSNYYTDNYLIYSLR